MKEAVDYYLSNNITQKDLCKKFNISSYMLKKYLKENNLGKGRNKWKYNDNYFSVIDTEDKAYWLGFIVADGCIIDTTQKNNKSTAVCLRIRLKETDKNHLEKLNHYINSNKPIKIVKNYGVYEGSSSLAEFQLDSRKIVKDLKNLGLQVGNKSTNEKPIKLDNKLQRKFILGLFDGDGHLTVTNKTLEFGIVSSKEMVVFIIKFLVKNLNIREPKIEKDHRCDTLYRFRIFNKNDIIKVLDYLYNDNYELCLDRKMEKYKYLLEKYNLM